MKNGKSRLGVNAPKVNKADKPKSKPKKVKKDKE